MKKIIPLLILITTPFTVFAHDIGIEELEGTWTWEEPVYKDGVMGISGYLDYTLIVSDTGKRRTREFILLDENSEPLLEGTCRIKKGILILKDTSSRNGNVRQYTISGTPAMNGVFELCVYSREPVQGVYFSLYKREE